jgi:hypothetical protein
MKKLFSLISLAFLTLSCGAGLFCQPTHAAKGSDDYRTYYNSRFSFSISYPVNVFTPQGESDNGDGQRFLSKDGRAEMTASGINNVLDETLADWYAEASRSTAEHPNRVVTYKTMKGNWFAVSGSEGERVFYQKTILKNRIFKTFRIEYDRALKSKYDPITAKMAGSFKGIGRREKERINKVRQRMNR